MKSTIAITILVDVVNGAAAKWEANGRNTQMIHGGAIDCTDPPIHKTEA